METICNIDKKIACLDKNLADLRVELQHTISTLRDANNVPGSLTTISRLGERLLSEIFQSADFNPTSWTMEKQIKEIVSKSILPLEMAVYLDTIRVLANKARHDSERAILKTSDAENALNALIRVIEWFYCECSHGPRYSTIYHDFECNPITACEAVHEMEGWLKEELDSLQQMLIKEGRKRHKLKKEFIVGLRPTDVGELFKDRIEKLHEFRKLLDNRTIKLIIIVGRGGIGKTAFLSKIFGEIEKEALRLNDAAKNMRVDGIAYVNCKKTDKPGVEYVYSAIARLIGSPYTEELLEFWKSESVSLQDKCSLLLSKTRSGCYFLVLDNFEDLLELNNTIENADLKHFFDLCLTTTHGLRIVATSRERWMTETTCLYGMRYVLLESGLPEDDAIALMRELDLTGEMGLKEASEQLLRTVAKKTFGIPHALETIAGLLHDDPTLDLDEFLKNDSLFNVHVVANLMKEHYKRLSFDGQCVLQSLSIFDRPVPSTAIKFLLMPFFSNMDIDHLLKMLVRNYFITYDRNNNTYEMHPLDRDYAYSCIPNQGREYSKEGLHGFAAAFWRKVRKNETEWKNILDLEPQLQEFSHLLRADKFDEAECLVDQIDNRYLCSWGYYKLLIEMRTGLIGKLTDAVLIQNNFINLGNAYWRSGESYKAIEYFEDALEMVYKTDNHRNHCIALNAMGFANATLGRLKDAMKFYQQSLVLARKHKMVEHEANLIGNLGNAYADQGEIPLAINHFKESIGIYEELGKINKLGYRLGNLGAAFIEEGNIREGLIYCERALDIEKRYLSRREQNRHLGNLASGYLRIGAIEKAHELTKEALSISQTIGDRRGETLHLGQLALIHYLSGELRLSFDFGERALSIAQEIGNRQRESKNLCIIGHAYLNNNEISKATEYFQKAYVLSQEIGAKIEMSHSLLHLADIKYLLNQLNEARDLYQKAFSCNISMINYNCVLKLGILSKHQNKVEEAKTYFNQTIDMCNGLLEKTSDLYEPLYTLALARLCNEENDEAARNYKKALSICPLHGVLQEVKRDLEIKRRAPGVSIGIGAVLELLEP